MKKVLIAAVLMLALCAGGAAGFFWLRGQKVAAFAQQAHPLAAPVTVLIKPGTGPKTLARELARAGAVTDADLLYEYLRREKLGPKLKAGEYEFTGSPTPAQVVEMIVSGEVKQYRFTVPEGLRAEEILPILARSELHLDLAKLQQLAADPRFLKTAGVPASRIEGFLFPDTYTFERGATEAQVLEKMVASALAAYRAADAQRLPGETLDVLQTFTLASIIEKETAAPEERPRISCVFHNRLRLGMNLATDPTVLYAMSLLRGTWLNNITRKDLLTPHPYNTYTTRGLPPGPIASPGAEALKAALHPLRCDDLFFVSQNNGHHVFCPDYACHEAAVKKWQQQYFRQKKQHAEKG